MILFALFLTSALGLVGLAVDVGHAYERRQFVQGAAYNAARAGAFEVYTNRIALPAVTGSAADAAVVERMVDTLASSGLTVANFTASTNRLTSPPSWSPCSQNLPTNSAYLQAFYLDGHNSQTSTPVEVGKGSYPTWVAGTDKLGDVRGVQVTQLVTCVQHFFVGVLHFGNFTVGSNAFLSLAGLAETQSSTTSNNGGVAPFYAFARKCQDTNPPSSPTCAQDPYTLYMPGAPASHCSGTTGAPCYGITYQAASSGCPGPIPPMTNPCSGDLVTIHDHSNGQGNWDAWQFVTPSAGIANVPSPALPLGSGSNRGCLDPNATNLAFGVWSFNQPGNGSHCGSSPNIGSVVVVPLVDYVCKNDSCGVTAAQDPTNTIGTCVSGGFCARIIGSVQITITQDLTTGKLVQGYITKVLQDPFCTVQTPAGQHPLPPTSSSGILAPSKYGATYPGDVWPTCP